MLHLCVAEVTIHDHRPFYGLCYCILSGSPTMYLPSVSSLLSLSLCLSYVSPATSLLSVSSPLPLPFCFFPSVSSAPSLLSVSLMIPLCLFHSISFHPSFVCLSLCLFPSVFSPLVLGRDHDVTLAHPMSRVADSRPF
jgi:hypothetical protein